MKNVKKSQLRQAIVMSLDAFEALLQDLYGEDAEIDIDENGICVDVAQDEIYVAAKDLAKKLSVYFGVQVTSVHSDSADYYSDPHIWIIYKKELDDDFWNVCRPGNFRQVVADTLGALVDSGKVKIAKANYLEVEDEITDMVRNNIQLLRR